jgi:hypothetical protein
MGSNSIWSRLDEYRIRCARTGKALTLSICLSKLPPEICSPFSVQMPIWPALATGEARGSSTQKEQEALAPQARD